jgi:hypothetical protein
VSGPFASFDLSGKAALVTGASSGLGRHAARCLAAAGAKVAVAARRLEPLVELEKQIAARDGRAIPLSLDVTDPASVADCVKTAETELGPISILVNNAGVAITKPALEVSAAEWDQVVDTNLKGAWLMAQAVAEHMVRLGHGGSIVNMASVLGLAGAAQVPAYCASKAGLVNLTRAGGRMGAPWHPRERAGAGLRRDGDQPRLPGRRGGRVLAQARAAAPLRHARGSRRRAAAARLRRRALHHRQRHRRRRRPVCCPMTPAAL